MRYLRACLAAVLVIAVAILAGCGSTKTVTKTVTTTPAPAIVPKPGAVPPPVHQAAPSCDKQEQGEIEQGKGSLGDCTPKPTTGAVPKAEVGATGQAVALQTVAANGVGQTGPDVSNNDPFYNWHPVRAHGHPFGYMKINQGVRFVDRTAAGMARGARAAHVIPGGYDFLEVCRTSATAEASLFVSRLRTIGLIANSLVPVGDAEWPLNAPCSASGARSWLNTWATAVHRGTGRWPAFYTGAWWANPNIGCWRPPGGGQRWISGYTFRRNLVIPCGWGGVDLWQFSSTAFNGVIHGDMSVLEVPLSHFTGASEPTPAQKRAAKRTALRKAKREVVELHGDIDRHHCRKGAPWYGHAKPARYHTVCEHWLVKGKAKKNTVKQLEHELR